MKPQGEISPFCLSASIHFGPSGEVEIPLTVCNTILCLKDGTAG